MPYIPRSLEPTLHRYLKTFPVVGVTGPRQSGKSTMLEHLLGSSYKYVSFDNLNAVDEFHGDPTRFMNTYANRVVFDEVQRVPEIFSYIKLAVDSDRKNYGKFVVTGSSQFAFMKRVSESLAGRIGLLSLLPFQSRTRVQHKRKGRAEESGMPSSIYLSPSVNIRLTQNQNVTPTVPSGSSALTSPSVKIHVARISANKLTPTRPMSTPIPAFARKFVVASVPLMSRSLFP